MFFVVQAKDLLLGCFEIEPAKKCSQSAKWHALRTRKGRNRVFCSRRKTPWVAIALCVYLDRPADLFYYTLNIHHLSPTLKRLIAALLAFWGFKTSQAREKRSINVITPAARG